jgi:hypothetical protein
VFRYCVAALFPSKVFDLFFRWAWLYIFSSIISPTDVSGHRFLNITTKLIKPFFCDVSVTHSSTIYILDGLVHFLLFDSSDLSSASHSTLACQMPGHQIHRLFHCSWTFCNDIIGNALVW